MHNRIAALQLGRLARFAKGKLIWIKIVGAECRTAYAAQIRAGLPLKAITPMKDSSELIEGRG